MASKVTKSRSFNIAFIVDEAQLKRLLSIINEVSTDITFNVSCSDGSGWEFSSLDEVLQMPNVKSKIQRIRLTTPWRSNPGLSVKLSSILTSDSVSYEVSGDEAKSVLHISDKLDDWALGVRQWYTLPSHPFFYLPFGVLVVTFSMLSNTIRSLLKEPYISRITIGMLIFSALYMVIQLNHRTLFPVGSFLIGGGTARNQSAVMWRGIIGSAVILGLIIEIVAAFLLS